MFILSYYFYTISWVWLLRFISCRFFLIFLFHLLCITSLSINVIMFPLSLSSFSISITSDIYSSSFSAVVCLISAVVFTFTTYYFSSFTKHKYFLWITFLFVTSILFLINFSDIFFVILGWDGLGVVSFFLILFYQSSIRVYSSLFTLLMNRLGDCFFVLLIVSCYTSFFSSSFIYFDFTGSWLLWPLFIVTFITKSALFPFSPWLPAAMSAPTPISSLVHSSTLVTAGLFLIIRNFVYLSSRSSVLHFLTLLGLFTSFYAGISSVVESDLKKVVALSTLSHLGFICFSLGLNIPNLAFLHLMAHALFKSALFIRLGSLISQYFHYQDSRLFSSIFSTNPFFSSIIVVSSSRLLGLPYVSGFYSKDLILESFSNLSRFLVFIIYINVIFTFTYTIRILFSLSTPRFMLVYSIVMPKRFLFNFLLFILSSLSIIFSLVGSKLVCCSMLYVPLALKFLPIIFLLATLVIAWLYLAKSIHLFYNFWVIRPIRFATNIINLTPLWSSSIPLNFVKTAHKLNRSLEYGGLYFTLVYGVYISTLNIIYLIIKYFMTARRSRVTFFLILLVFVRYSILS